MNLTRERQGDCLLVRVDDDRIDAAAAIRFKDAMREATADGSGRVILDLTRVQFVDSSGLGAIVAVMKFLAPQQTLELAGLGGNVARVFRLTRMDTVFVLHDRVPTADCPAAMAAPGDGVALGA